MYQPLLLLVEYRTTLCIVYHEQFLFQPTQASSTSASHEITIQEAFVALVLFRVIIVRVSALLSTRTLPSIATSSYVRTARDGFPRASLRFSGGVGPRFVLLEKSNVYVWGEGVPSYAMVRLVLVVAAEPFP